jgi:hypothetical protein
MGALRDNNSAETTRLLELARAGGKAASDAGFARHRSRLRRMVELRLDYFLVAKGLAEYRAGHPEQAIDWLCKSLSSPVIARPEYNTLIQLLLSMAFHRLGRRDEARQALAQARAFITAQQENGKGEDTGKDNVDWLRRMSVLPEAESIIEGKPR